MTSLRGIAPVLAVFALSVWSTGCSSKGATSGSASNPVASKLKSQQQAPGGAEAEETNETIALDQVPQVVWDAVQQALPGGQILVAQRENENGQMLYGFRVSVGADKREIKVDDQGTVIKIEKDDEGESETETAGDGDGARDTDAVEHESGTTGDTGDSD